MECCTCCIGSVGMMAEKSALADMAVVAVGKPSAVGAAGSLEVAVVAGMAVGLPSAGSASTAGAVGSLEVAAADSLVATVALVADNLVVGMAVELV